MEKSIKKSGKVLNLKLPAKAGIYYIAASALSKSVGIITTPIFTRLLTGEEYGKYTLYMSILGLSTLICSTGVSQSVIYNGLEKFEKQKREFIFSAFLSGIGFVSAFCILLFIFNRFLGLGVELTLVLAFQLFCDVLISICQTARRHEYNYRALSVTNAISVITTPLISVILILGGVGYKGRIYALLLVSLGISSVLLSKLLSHSKSAFTPGLSLYVIKRTLPLLPNSVSSAIAAEADKLILGGILGTAALAKYSVAHTLGVGLGFGITAVSASLYPWVIRKLSRGESHAVLPVFSAMLLSLSALTIALSLALPELFSLLAPSSYSEAILGSYPLLLSALPTFGASFITLGIIHAEHGGYTSVSAVISLASNIVLCLLLIPSLSYLGAGLSILLSSLISLPTSLRFLKKCAVAEIFSAPVFIKIFILTLIGVSLAWFSRGSLAIRIFIMTLPATMLLFAYSNVRELISEV